MPVDEERDDEIVPWDPPEDVRAMIRAAREDPPMTKEEEDRAIARAQRWLAADREQKARERRKWARPKTAALAAAGAVAVALACGGAALVIARGQPTPRRPRLAAEPLPPRTLVDAGPDAAPAARPPR
jgi:hypothetical protein